MLKKFFSEIKDFLASIIKSRIFVMAVAIIALFAIAVNRLFVLQIINGEDYLNNFTLKIEKERNISSTRGKIYDKNGNLLAYNELAYNVTIEDNGTYETQKEKNNTLNTMIYKLINVIEGNGDHLVNDFGISSDEYGNYNFLISGSSLTRFLADVYGHSSVDDLEYNKDLGYNESEATAQDVMEYLCSKDVYNISSDDYTNDDMLKLASIRFAISLNSYQKYLSTTISTEVSNKTVACVMENTDDFQGVNIEESTVRKYVDSKYFASIIGYTGKISEDEYENLSSQNDSYTLTDVVGKSGIEQVMELELQGTKGHETVFVDNLGKVLETSEYVDAVSGNDVYLTIDKDLQENAYNIIEQKLAGILYEKIINQINYTISPNTKASDIRIPISDVYFALINNNIIDISHFTSDDASENEKSIYSIFSNRLESVTNLIESILNDESGKVYNAQDETTQTYLDYIIKQLTSEGIIVSSNINTSDENYTQWKNGELSIRDYLLYAISQNWVDTIRFNGGGKYSDSNEIYTQLENYITSELINNNSFYKLIYKSLIHEDAFSASELCLTLFDQGVITANEDQYSALSSGKTSAYNFIMEKIKNIEITPGQLGLDPCSGSCVITDVNTGKVLALVSYPGYDNNKLANTVDAQYYAKLTNDLSYPLYNHATQEKTAPGSTFKMVTATAGLTENVIGTSDTITCKGEFTTIQPSPKCWIYPSAHGSLNITEAIRDSCNYFFYEVGYRLSTGNGNYDANKGINLISKYAQMYGLGSKSGVEIVESEPHISTEYPVTSAIGQGNHNFTTIQLARYVSTVANSGTLYNLTLLDKVTDNEGKTIKNYSPDVADTLDDVSDSTWTAIHSGMRMVVEKLDAFKNMKTEVSGKTGTAEEVTNRGNHALFVGYAPSNNPEIAIATRIAYGYTSSNTAEIASNILKYYFKEEGYENILNGTAIESTGQVVGD